MQRKPQQYANFPGNRIRVGNIFRETKCVFYRSRRIFYVAWMNEWIPTILYCLVKPSGLFGLPLSRPTSIICPVLFYPSVYILLYTTSLIKKLRKIKYIMHGSIYLHKTVIDKKNRIKSKTIKTYFCIYFVYT